MPLLFITVGVSFPDCDKASGGMRTDLQRKAAKAAANLAPSPLGADLNYPNSLAEGFSCLKIIVISRQDSI